MCLAVFATITWMQSINTLVVLYRHNTINTNSFSDPVIAATTITTNTIDTNSFSAPVIIAATTITVRVVFCRLAMYDVFQGSWCSRSCETALLSPKITPPWRFTS